MIHQFEAVAAACDLGVSARYRRGIGIVGAGAIVDGAHLPAYRGAGLPVLGIFDTDSARAHAVAERHGVREYTSLDDLLADPRVEVVDIAVIPDAQGDVAHRALAAGKHVLAQKPFARDLDAARALVREAEERGLLIAVNQQLRFDEGFAAARAMMATGWIGEPLAVSITVSIDTNWGAWPWMSTSPTLDLWYHSIHYLDAVRYLLGDPVSVYSTASRYAGQGPAGETRTISVLVYDNDVRAVVHTFHGNTWGDAEAGFRIEGTQGVIKGTLGLLYDYPHGRPDTLLVRSDVVPTDGWLCYPVTGRWLPDAFVGPMKSLLTAIVDGGQPVTSGSDNLRTLALVMALYRSIETGQAQDPRDGVRSQIEPSHEITSSGSSNIGL